MNNSAYSKANLLLVLLASGKMNKQISKCRICGNQNLVSVLNLGEQALTGVFPKNKTEHITSGPLELVKCHPFKGEEEVCHLVQLRHSYDSEEMYGMNYGYRSGLNASMVRHLQSIVSHISSFVILNENDLIVDIGSNDSTLLQFYPKEKNLALVGIDPTGVKFKKYYPAHIQLIPDFFSAEVVTKKYPGRKAKVVTSIAMFYDLEDPGVFVKQVYDVLADDGIWVFEQSYLPSMLQTNSYDTVCHEHLEYYSLRQIKYLADKIGFRIVDVELNDTNGGSFRVTAAKKGSHYASSDKVGVLEAAEQGLMLDTLKPFQDFEKNVSLHREELCKLIIELKAQGKTIFGYGASTKGNVILQCCGLTQEDIPYIAEVNEDKMGSFTPYTHIPIISEVEARKMKPDYFLVLPWHFRKGILEKEADFMKSGGKFIFPLPKIDIVGV